MFFWLVKLPKCPVLPTMIDPVPIVHCDTYSSVVAIISLGIT